MSPGGARLPAVAALLAIGFASFPAAAQELTRRSPNLSGNWTGTPGTLEFHFDHRFWLLGERVFNSPTFLVGVPVTDGWIAGGRYASNSRVAQGSSNEWELFGRWAGSPGDWPVAFGATGGYNIHASSLDGELALSASLGHARVLTALRAFSDVGGTGDPGWFAGGGVVVPLRPWLSMAGDLGQLWREEGSERRVWGVGLQLEIPTTPHTLALRATNTRTGTLQGTSMGLRTTWGFEFTIPFTVRRYFRRGSGHGAATEPPAEGTATDEEVEVTMTEDLRFDPETLRVRVGQTVAWRNTSSVPHTVTADPAAVRDPGQVSLPDGAEPFDSGFIFPDEVFRHTFRVPGEYMYICVPHDMAPMIGRIVVEP